MSRFTSILVFVCVGLLHSSANCQDSEANSKTVKVFILAGQSNMEGKAPNKLLEHQANNEKTKSLFAHLRKNDQWIERDDVMIKFLKRSGGLTIGYGSRNRTGIELEFGTVVGDHFDEPVLLIKTAWGGHSLFKNFRPPSSGLPPEKVLQEELEKAKERVEKNNAKRNKEDPLPTMEDITTTYGSSYRLMMTDVKDTLANCETIFPRLGGRELEVAGFVWFQGWNDQYGSENEYANHMAAFIRDVRKDLGVAKLPFVIGVMGQNGSEPAKGAMLTIQTAQLSMQEMDEFKGNVKSVRTDELVDKAAEKLYPEWKNRFEEWQLTGGDRKYHYLGSAIWFNRIGKKMGQSMLELISNSN
ncbi:MAG: sialate O-acetylesterase [Mariniblastus sp.]